MLCDKFTEKQHRNYILLSFFSQAYPVIRALFHRQKLGEKKKSMQRTGAWKVARGITDALKTARNISRVDSLAF